MSVDLSKNGENRARFFGFAGLILVVFTWLLVVDQYPLGVVTDDGFSQIREAASQSYSNLHPPLMAKLTSAFVAKSVNHGLVSFALLIVSQSLAMLVGFYIYVKLIARDDKCATYVVSLFIALTPIALYSVFYLKDTWLAIFLVWIGCLYISRPEFRLTDVLVFSIMAGVASHLRHNALVLLPIFVLMVLSKTRSKLRWMALGPVVIYALLLLFMRDARDSHPHSQVKILDMVQLHLYGVDVPYLDMYMYREFPKDYDCTNQGQLYNYIDFNGMAYSNPPALMEAYVKMITDHPILWLKAKAINYWTFLWPAKYEAAQTDSWCSGVKLQHHLDAFGFREPMATYFHSLTESRLWLFVNKPLWWLLISAGMLFTRYRFIALLSLAYLFSFVPAVVNAGYRFSLPSYVLIQPLFVVFLWRLLYERLDRHD